MKERKQKGITLIALVVTIIVLLILAGITINLAFNNNGILKRAENAKEQNDAAAQEEQQIINDLDNAIEFDVNPSIKVKQGEKATANGTIDGKAPNAYNPIIPKGYYPIKTDTTTWQTVSEKQKEENVNKGLVITDNVDSSGNSNGNEWVWVPVLAEELKDLYIKEDVEITNGPINSVMTNYHTNSITLYQGVENKGINTRVKPNFKSGFREPDILNHDDYDKKSSYLQILGVKDADDMTLNLVKDYNDMILSLEKYHGFYIGRYELSANGEKRDKSAGGQNWYVAYKHAKDIIPKEAEGKVSTRMIWGVQWDATCKWIAIKGERKNIQDSSAWGNYNNISSSLKHTGSNADWEANNIYDLAGNCWEWTQEAHYSSFRVVRGGGYESSGSYAPASRRSDRHPDFNGSTYYYSSRATLYVK